MKIVSLLPSATEIVCALGFESSLVGVSHECDWPPSVSSLPKLTKSNVDHTKASREIHESVEDRVKKTISVYDLDLDLLKSLEPDVIVTQDLCDVCAVPFPQVREACDSVLGESVKVVPLKPLCLDDVWQDVTRVAEALGAPEDCQAFHEQKDKRIKAVRDGCQGAEAVSVLTLEWLDPVYVGGLWLPDMIEILGGNSLFAKSGERAPVVDKQMLAEVNPDVLVVKPCGFKLDQMLRELDTLKQIVPWETWNAFQNRQVFLIDGNSYFNRPGPRLLESLEILAACCYPDRFKHFLETYSEGMIRLTPDCALP